MNPWWVAAAAVLPLLVALLVAWPFWRKRVGDEMGTVMGAFVVFTCVILFVGREYLESEKTRVACVVREIGCRFYPKLFTRFMIYGGIGMTHVMVLFVVGLSVEERLRQRERERLQKAHSNRLKRV
jgi:hypothetical protein